MKLNTKPETVRTHEGGKASRINNKATLQRTVLSCFLWEDTFYEDGQSIADRIAKLVPTVEPEFVSNLAKMARSEYKLRHVPLLLVREMARHDTHKSFVADTLSNVIQRPDELTEFLSIYWKDKKQPLANSIKKGLAVAFTKFDEYSLAKYNRENAIKLRDVLFLCHAKPKDKAQEDLWKRLINNELATPDTWEVELSAGQGSNKKGSWTRLLSENKLGVLALLRNLRNFIQNGVDDNLIREALRRCNPERALPYRFITAAKYAPKFEPELEQLMLKCLEKMERIPGKTCVLIDCSGSMNSPISQKSEMNRIEAACGLAILARELCETVVIYGFSNTETLIPARRGFALRDAIMKNFGGGTYLKKSMTAINAKEKYDRMIIFTDEQSQDGIAQFNGKGYICNVASYQNGVGYGDNCVHINGFSEASLRFICELEKSGAF